MHNGVHVKLRLRTAYCWKAHYVGRPRKVSKGPNLNFADVLAVGQKLNFAQIPQAYQHLNEPVYKLFCLQS